MPLIYRTCFNRPQGLIFWRTCLGLTSRPASHGNDLPIPPSIRNLETSEEMSQASSWVNRFKSTTIPRGLVELTFSRSSGPGGQNVNKLNTKATLRCSLNSSWIPLWARTTLKETPNYVSSSHSILITSTLHRSQAQNIDDCLTKLHGLILSASSKTIKSEPTESQKRKVADYIKADKARTKIQKMHRSEIKKSRSSRGGDW